MFFNGFRFLVLFNQYVSHGSNWSRDKNQSYFVHLFWGNAMLGFKFYYAVLSYNTNKHSSIEQTRQKKYLYQNQPRFLFFVVWTLSSKSDLPLYIGHRSNSWCTLILSQKCWYNHHDTIPRMHHMLWKKKTFLLYT